MTQIILFFIVGLVLAYIFKSYAQYEKSYPYEKIHKDIKPTYDSIAKSELGLFVALCAKVAKADGRIDELEAELISNLLDDVSKVFSDPQHARDILKEIFAQNKSGGDIDTIIEDLNQLLKRDSAKKLQMLTFLFNLAFVDGRFSQEEEERIEYISYYLGVSKEDYEAIKAKFHTNFSHVRSDSSLKEAYKTLGVDEDSDLATIKKAYRKLVKKYHPDIIKAQGKSEDYIQEATQKVQEINAAYELIKASKNG